MVLCVLTNTRRDRRDVVTTVEAALRAAGIGTDGPARDLNASGPGFAALTAVKPHADFATVRSAMERAGVRLVLADCGP